MPLIDAKIILKWTEARHLAKNLPVQSQAEILQAIIHAFCSRLASRVSCEIYTETILVWLAVSLNKHLTAAIADQFSKESNGILGCEKLVELALTAEITDSDHQQHCLEAAVILVCEIGKALIEQHRKDPNPERLKALSHLTTYLLSVSNHNNYAIRLSLIHYFGFLSSAGYHRTDFERVLERFGYTVLDFVFSLLFKKNTESLALQYLLENVPLVLETESSAQRIVHDIFKYYLLKKPDRFSLFLRTLGDWLMTNLATDAKRMYLKHLGALLKIVAQLNHRPLTNDIMACIYRVEDPFLDVIHEMILKDPGFDFEQKNLARTLFSEDKSNQKDPLEFLRLHKRGRHPTFNRSRKIEFVEQISQLSSKQHTRC